MKKWMFATILICGTAMVLNSCNSNDNPVPEDSKDAGAPDYSQKSCWYNIPEITPQISSLFPHHLKRCSPWHRKESNTSKPLN